MKSVYVEARKKHNAYETIQEGLKYVVSPEERRQWRTSLEWFGKYTYACRSTEVLSFDTLMDNAERLGYSTELMQSVLDYCDIPVNKLTQQFPNPSSQNYEKVKILRECGRVTKYKLPKNETNEELYKSFLEEQMNSFQEEYDLSTEIFYKEQSSPSSVMSFRAFNSERTVQQIILTAENCFRQCIKSETVSGLKLKLYFVGNDCVYDDFERVVIKRFFGTKNRGYINPFYGVSYKKTG